MLEFYRTTIDIGDVTQSHSLNLAIDKREQFVHDMSIHLAKEKWWVRNGISFPQRTLSLADTRVNHISWRLDIQPPELTIAHK